ncbi:MAG: hypothetical protein ABIU09_05875 [Pyrinomonadaceae bacterium]
MKQTAKNSLDDAASRKLSLRRSGHAYCPVCAKQAELISFNGAADLFHTDLQDIEFLAKRGDIHQIHNRKGSVMVCSVSLFECFEARRTRLLDTGFFEELAAKKSA